MSLLPITVLRRARKLIADRKNWIKGAFIGKRKGVQCYCGQGALAAAAGIKIKSGAELSDAGGGKLPPEYYTAHRLLLEAAGVTWFPFFNDEGNHARVLKAFDKAIAAAKAAPKV
jgi:hypothetical protein